MTTLTSTSTSTRPSTRPAAAAGSGFELRSGPQTIVGGGETCLVCGDPLSPGEVYLFVAWDGDSGVAHEDCAEFEAAAAAAGTDGGESLGDDPVAGRNGTATRDGGGRL